MKKKRNVAITVLIALTVLLGTTTAWSVLEGFRPPPVMPGGVYTGVHPALMVPNVSEPTVSSLSATMVPMAPLCNTITETVTPIDPACNILAFIYKCDCQDPTLACMKSPLSEADHVTDFVGNMVRTDWNTWDYTGVAYGTKKVEGQSRPELVYIIVVQGTAKYTSDGHSKVAEGTFSVYGPEQDADKDGFPDEGQIPVHHCGPTWSRRVVRIPVLSSL